LDSSRQTGVLVLLGVLFTIILAGLDNTIVSTVMPVALPELGGAHLYAWTFAAYMLAAAVSMPIWGPGSDRWGRRRTYLIGIVAFTVGSGLDAWFAEQPVFNGYFSIANCDCRLGGFIASENEMVSGVQFSGGVALE